MFDCELIELNILAANINLMLPYSFEFCCIALKRHSGCQGAIGVMLSH